MSRVRRTVLASLAAVTASSIVAATPASAALLVASYGANRGYYSSTTLSACDGENDGRWVQVQIEVQNVHGQGFTYVLRNNNGSGTCTSVGFAGYDQHRRRLRVCEYVAKYGVQGCGSWVSSPAPA